MIYVREREYKVDAFEAPAYPDNWVDQFAASYGGSDNGFLAEVIPCIDGLLIQEHVRESHPEFYWEVMRFAHTHDLIIEKR